MDLSVNLENGARQYESQVEGTFESLSSIIEHRHRAEHKSQLSHHYNLGPHSFHPSEPASLCKNGYNLLTVL